MREKKKKGHDAVSHVFAFIKRIERIG